MSAAPDLENLTYTIVVPPPGVRLDRVWRRLFACERRVAVCNWVASLTPKNSPPSRSQDDELGFSLSALGLQLEVKAASPVPGRGVYAPVHVQLLENAVHMVLHRCQFDS